MIRLIKRNPQTLLSFVKILAYDVYKLFEHQCMQIRKIYVYMKEGGGGLGQLH